MRVVRPLLPYGGIDLGGGLMKIGHEYDAIIVGAGPTGSHAARYAAQGGANVLIIEKRQEVGSPVRCGEGAARKSIEDAGITPNKKWIAAEMDGARIYAPNETYLEVDESMAGDEVGYVIERDLFDQWLADQAVQAGADIALKTTATRLLMKDGKVNGVRVKQMGEERDIWAKVVVGADGYESDIGRWAGILPPLAQNDIIAGIQYRMTDIDIDSNFVQFYLTFKYAPGGYTWIFPKNENTANVGIGMTLSNLPNKGDLKNYLDSWIAAHPNISKGKVLDIVGGGVPVCAPIDKTVTDGLMLLGDAARQADPITGGGIGNGCKAAVVCGRTIAAAVKENDFSAEFLQMYEKGWRDILEEKLFRNWMAKETFIKLSDDVFNKIIPTISEYGLDEINVFNLLKVIAEKHPELVETFEDLI